MSQASRTVIELAAVITAQEAELVEQRRANHELSSRAASQGSALLNITQVLKLQPEVREWRLDDIVLGARSVRDDLDDATRETRVAEAKCVALEKRLETLQSHALAEKRALAVIAELRVFSPNGFAATFDSCNPEVRAKLIADLIKLIVDTHET